MSAQFAGRRALSDPVADITDVYAFPSPQRPGRLVLVMNTLPFAQPRDTFSDGLIYRFRLRQLSARDGAGQRLFDIDDREVTVDVLFDEPDAEDPDAQDGVVRS